MVAIIFRGGGSKNQEVVNRGVVESEGDQWTGS